MGGKPPVILAMWKRNEDKCRSADLLWVDEMNENPLREDFIRWPDSGQAIVSRPREYRDEMSLFRTWMYETPVETPLNVLKFIKNVFHLFISNIVLPSCNFKANGPTFQWSSAIASSKALMVGPYNISESVWVPVSSSPSLIRGNRIRLISLHKGLTQSSACRNSFKSLWAH